MKKAKAKAKAPTDPKRGEPAPTGGIWVGRSKNRVAWIAYKSSDFGPMCETFDAMGWGVSVGALALAPKARAR